MIDGAMLKRINDEIGSRPPDDLCAELGVDAAGVREAMEGLGLGLSEQARGTIAIALFIGIKAGQESKK